MANIMAVRWQRLYRGTKSELALEPAVAAIGVPYRTQWPGFLYGARFFPDFVLPTIGLVIEVDDRSHNDPEKRASDEERTAKLRELYGWRVVRCTNEEAEEDPHGTIRRLLSAAGVTELDLTRARRRPLEFPRPKKCPRKDRRSAKSAERKSRRTRN